MSLPELTVDLIKIRDNTRAVITLAAPFGIEIVGVTKSFLGEPRIAAAMLEGGIRVLADSRLENLTRLRQAFPLVPLMLLRLPALSQTKDVVDVADISLNSDLTVLKSLSEAAVRLGKTHGVILMVDLGDLREGVWPSAVPELFKQAAKLPGIQMRGIGVNMACYGGVIPTRENMIQLLDLAKKSEKLTGIAMEIVSGGNSAALPLLLNKQIPTGINQLRIGEGIVLGRETTERNIVPGAFTGAFVLRAEVIECYTKPTVPIGSLGQDAFGATPRFRNLGWRKRGILAIGRQDISPEALVPRNNRIAIFGASSDHLIVDLSEAPELQVGSVVEFDLLYGGLLGAMTSPYVNKVFYE